MTENKPKAKAKPKKKAAAKKTAKKKEGRPTDYNDKIANEICERLSDGESLKDICASEKMPARSTVYRWTHFHEDFSVMYDRAREEQAETLADEIISIADETVNDKMINDNGNEVVNSEAIARSRLKVDARKWVASKLKPRKYGDKLQTENKSTVTLEGMSDEELDARLNALKNAQ